ncbi:MAG TPA: ROK family protein [Phycisphaerae bacterium]|nr:ROK family protein [Phycisphaerae bacterium]
MDERETLPILGWDVGGTKSAAVVATARGEVLDRAEWPSQAGRGPEPMIAEFLAQGRELLRKHPGVASLGVSIGGPLDAHTGTILSPPHLPGWDRVSLADRLRRELGLDVVVEHDAAACLLAEWLWGAARGATHAAYLTCGTGCGAGVLIGGRLLRGPRGQTPEAGHIRLSDHGPRCFGKAGSAEAFGSGTGIARLAKMRFPERFAESVTARDLHRMHVEGDSSATAVLLESARRTGQLCAILGDLFCPQVIVLGSLARYLGSWWVEKVRAEFVREVLPACGCDTNIVPPELGERLQDLSAVAPCLAAEAR